MNRPPIHDSHRAVFDYHGWPRTSGGASYGRRRNPPSVLDLSCAFAASAIGLFVLGVVIGGLRGDPNPRWTSPVPVRVKPAIQGRLAWYSLEVDAELARGQETFVSFHLPSRGCVLIWLIGLGLLIPAFVRRGPAVWVVASLGLLMSGVTLSTLTLALLWIEWIPQLAGR